MGLTLQNLENSFGLNLFGRWYFLLHFMVTYNAKVPDILFVIQAWLDPINLPSGSSSLCDFCREPLQFLLQVQ